MSQTATASAPTENASRYLQQLCKHWSHKAEVSFSPEAGDIAFPSGNRLHLSATPDHLAMTATVPAEADLAVFRDVVDKHLVRFAFREDLEITWQPGG